MTIENLIKLYNATEKTKRIVKLLNFLNSFEDKKQNGLELIKFFNEYN